jgi:hypothetical protein
VQGGGAGVAPSTITTGTGVVTALGVNTGTAGAFVVNGGALGTPSSGTVTNLTGTASININGTVGATTATTVKATTIEGTDTTDASSTTAAALKTAGGLGVAKKIYVGDNIVQATASKGFNFTANTPQAGMTSQLLNWYEEGTWTPIDSSGASLSFTSVSGVYTRVGRLVTCTFGLTFPATVSVLGATIGGLPFTSLSTGTPNPSGGSITYTGAAISAAGFAVGAGGTTVALYGASGTAIGNNTFSGFILRAQFTYHAN